VGRAYKLLGRFENISLFFDIEIKKRIGGIMSVPAEDVYLFGVFEAFDRRFAEAEIALFCGIKEIIVGDNLTIGKKLSRIAIHQKTRSRGKRNYSLVKNAVTALTALIKKHSVFIVKANYKLHNHYPFGFMVIFYHLRKGLSTNYSL
jgi:hypothetical protein